MDTLQSPSVTFTITPQDCRQFYLEIFKRPNNLRAFWTKRLPLVLGIILSVSGLITAFVTFGAARKTLIAANYPVTWDLLWSMVMQCPGIIDTLIIFIFCFALLITGVGLATCARVFWLNGRYIYKTLQLQNLVTKTLTLTPGALVIRYEQAETTRPWDSFIDIVHGKDQLLLLLSDQLGLFIPKRVFPSQADYQQFLEHAQHFWNQAKQNG